MSTKLKRGLCIKGSSDNYSQYVISALKFQPTFRAYLVMDSYEVKIVGTPLLGHTYKNRILWIILRSIIKPDELTRKRIQQIPTPKAKKSRLKD